MVKWIQFEQNEFINIDWNKIIDEISKNILIYDKWYIRLLKDINEKNNIKV